ncbi:MAG: WD40 repeat domain-containing protein [Planctomycetaceae bacterium]
MDQSQVVKYRVIVLSALTTVHTAEIEWQEGSSDLRCLSLSDDGKTVLTGVSSGDVRLWNVDTGELLKQRSFAGADLWDAALSPDGQSVVLAGLKDSFLWQYSDGAEPIRLDQKNSNVARFAPNGRVFATSGWEGAQIWNAADGKLLASLKSESSMSPDGGIAFTPDSHTLAVPVSGSNNIELWDVETQQRVATLPTHEPRAVAISQDGKWLAATGGDSVVSIFDLPNRQLVSTPSEGHANPLVELHFTTDGGIVTSSYDNARVWDVASGKLQHVLAHEKQTTIRGLAVSPDNSTIVTSGFDDTLGVWDRTTGIRLFTLKGHGTSGGCRSVRFTADGAQFVSWGDDAQLRRWDAKQGTLIAEYDLRPPGFEAQGQLAEMRGVLATNTDTLFVRLKNELIEFDTRTGKLTREVPAEFNSQLMAISPDGKWLASAMTTRDANGEIIGTDIVLIDVSTLKVARRWPVTDPDQKPAEPGQPRRISVGDNKSMAFSPDSRQLAWAQDGDRSLIVVADVASERILRRIPIDSPTWCVEFSPDGSKLASGQYDTTVSLWDLKNSKFVVATAAKQNNAMSGLNDQELFKKEDISSSAYTGEKTPKAGNSSVVARIQGLISDVDVGRNIVRISVGADDGLVVGQVLEVYETLPGSNKPWPVAKGKIRVTNDIDPDKAMAQIIQLQPNAVLQRGDYVVDAKAAVSTVNPAE